LTQFNNINNLTQSIVNYYQFREKYTPYIGGFAFNTSITQIPVPVSTPGKSDPRLNLGYTLITESSQKAATHAVLASMMSFASQSVLDVPSADPSSAAPPVGIMPSLKTFVTGAKIDVASQIVPAFVVNGEMSLYTHVLILK
jgi:hypothetical protein